MSLKELLADNALFRDLIDMLLEWTNEMSAYLQQKGLSAEFQCWQRGADLNEAIEGLEEEEE